MTKYILILLFPITVFAKGTPDSLQTIDLQFKNLTTLPSNLLFSKIGTLHLGYNSISDLPTDLLAAKNLNYLSIDFAKKLNLESSINVLKKLPINTLSMNSSNLLYMPIELGDFKQLSNISLTNNFIKSIPEYIFIHGDFYSVNLSGNYIQEIPNQIKTQANLSSLNLSYNPCINKQATYQNINQLSNLKELSIKGAQDLPQNLWDNVYVQKIDISDATCSILTLRNKLTKQAIKEFIAKDCHNLDFNTLFPLLSNNELIQLTLGGDGFKGFNNVTLSNNITYMNLSGNTLESFSLNNTLPNLESIELNFKNITCQNELVRLLTNSKNLKNLNLSNCQLTSLPSQLTQLKSLENLNLSNNKLVSITELSKLKNLVTLDLSLCPITKEQISKLQLELPNTTIIYNELFTKVDLPNAVAKTEKFTVSPSNPQPIITENGTIITIPKNSLVYQNGTAIKEDVTINYTPYYNLAEIATSNINMDYSEKGEIAPFSSAGMFNLNASVDGVPVELKKGKDIKIEFKSTDDSQSYNYYLYDSVKRTWKEIGNDSIKKVKVEKQKDTLNGVKKDFTNSTFGNLVPQPQIYYTNYPIDIHWDINKNGKHEGTFSINADKKSNKVNKDTSSRDNYFYEVSELSKYRWKLVSSNAKKSIKTFSHENKLMSYDKERRWLNLSPRYVSSTIRKDKYVEFELIADRESDDFIFKFYDAKDTVEFHAYPEINGRNIDRTQKNIKKLFTNFTLKSNERKEITKYRKNKFQTAYFNFQRNMATTRFGFEAYQEKSLDELLSEKINTNDYGITRVLQLQGFGVYNCDRPIPYENPIVFSGDFLNENGKRIESSNIRLVDPRLNISQTFYDANHLKVSKNSVISVIISNNSGNTYVGKINTLGESKRPGKVTVQLTKLPKSTTVKELNDFINLL